MIFVYLFVCDVSDIDLVWADKLMMNIIISDKQLQFADLAVNKIIYSIMNLIIMFIMIARVCLGFNLGYLNIKNPLLF